MDFLQGLALITFIHLLAAASPGPDFVLVSQQALSNGKRAALLTSAGIALGLSIHLLYSIAGLATIIAHSEQLLWLIKVVGGSYLLYLGSQGLTAKTTPGTVHQATTAPLHRSWGKQLAMGFACNAFNPKAPIYFVSVFTLVLSPEMPVYQLVSYGVWMMLLQFAWFALVSCFLSLPKVSGQFQRMGHWLDRVLGGAMIIMGLKVLISS